jgi:hypothetical protein
MTLDRGASFEPDEHLATLVLRHVGGVRDRLALECVSRVWRAVGRGFHSLTSQLNLRALFGIGGARRGCVARVKEVLGVV